MRKTKIKYGIYTAALLMMGAIGIASSLSFLLAEKELGSAAQSGNSLAAFALGGFLMGIVFGRIMGALRKLTLAFGFLILACS